MAEIRDSKGELIGYDLPKDDRIKFETFSLEFSNRVGRMESHFYDLKTNVAEIIKKLSALNEHTHNLMGAYTGTNNRVDALENRVGKVESIIIESDKKASASEINTALALKSNEKAESYIRTGIFVTASTFIGVIFSIVGLIFVLIKIFR
jgi:hypothetical protein